MIEMEEVFVKPKSERKRDTQIPGWELRNSSCVHGYTSCYWNFTSECLSDYLTCFFWHSYSLLYWHFYSFVRLHWIHLPYSGLVTKILIDIVFHPTCLRSSVHEVPTNWKQKYLSFLYSFRYWLRHQIINVPNKAVNKGSKWPNSSGCLFFSSNSILRDISGVI